MSEPGDGAAGPVIDHLRVNPAGLTPPNNFTHAVGAGDLYFLSGQVGRGPDGQIAGPGDIVAQTRQAFANLTIMLDELALEWGDVVKLGIYLTDMSGLREIRQVRADIFARAGCEPPAITTIGIESLAAPEAMIEIEAFAVRRRRASPG